MPLCRFGVSAVLCCVALTMMGCDAPPAGGLDGAVSDSDSSVMLDARVEHADGGDVGDRDAATTTIPDASAADEPDAGPIDPIEPDRDPRFEVEMTYMTANIGRNYDTRAQMASVFNRIGDIIGPRTGPKFIGWQEIGEGDPCGGSCEIEELRGRFRTEWSWETRHPRGSKPNGGTERVKVPVTSKGANADIAVRAAFASPGWAGVSPTRFVTVVHYASRNVSVVNTHLIAGAWACRSEVARRRDYWRRGWGALKDEVAREHARGRNVIVTGDLNRPRGSNSCNPAWNPASLHPRARVIGGESIDYIFAVPAAEWRFVVSRRPDGTAKRASIQLGIDSHKAHWVAGTFLLSPP